MTTKSKICSSLISFTNIFETRTIVSNHQIIFSTIELKKAQTSIILCLENVSIGPYQFTFFFKIYSQTNYPTSEHFSTSEHFCRLTSEHFLTSVHFPKNVQSWKNVQRWEYPRQITEVKLRRAGLVLTWVTGREYLVC